MRGERVFLWVGLGFTEEGRGVCPSYHPNQLERKVGLVYTLGKNEQAGRMSSYRPSCRGFFFFPFGKKKKKNFYPVAAIVSQCVPIAFPLRPFPSFD